MNFYRICLPVSSNSLKMCNWSLGMLEIGRIGHFKERKIGLLVDDWELIVIFNFDDKSEVKWYPNCLFCR